MVAFSDVMLEGHSLSRYQQPSLERGFNLAPKKYSNKSRLLLQYWMSLNSTSYLYHGNPQFSLCSCPSPAKNVAPAPSLVTETISKYINHFRKSFHDKYQTRLRKVSKKARYRYCKYFDTSVWNNIQMLLL